MDDIECIDCPFYDPENDTCTAFSCDPLSCDDPLPCEVGGVDIDDDMP